MFTQATRHFGVWKAGHGSRARYAGQPTFGVILALSMCAFVGWLAFFLCLKIRGEMFLLETARLNLARVEGGALGRGDSGILGDARPSAFSLGLHKTAEGAVRVIFDSGETFSFPAEKARMLAYLAGRMDIIELTGMISLSADDALRRVQIWPDARLSSAELSDVLSSLTMFGFDDFDIALHVER